MKNKKVLSFDDENRFLSIDTVDLVNFLFFFGLHNAFVLLILPTLIMFVC